MANWERLAEQSSGLHVVADYERAGYRLMMEQVLYGTDRGSRAAYDLIVKHLGAYRELLARFGMELKHNHLLSYVVAIPTHNVAEKMRLAETRLALVLVRLYDDKMHAAEVVAGEATIELEELERAYKELLKRELPDRGDLRDYLVAMKRYGVARAIDADDDQPFQIVIRPAITEVLGETALLQLAAHAKEVGEEDENEAA